MMARPAPEDGYELWLRYPQVDNAERLAEYRAAIQQIYFFAHTPTLVAARDELLRGLSGLLGQPIPLVNRVTTPNALFAFTMGSVPLGAEPNDPIFQQDHFSIEFDPARGVTISAFSDVGVLYGVFHLLRHLQTHKPLVDIPVASAPKIKYRLLNHWDNLDGTIERGYAGFSLWDWHKLPDYVSSRYVDYARACASVGINGAVLNNVNAKALSLTHGYLIKAAALANVFRPYGIRVYLSARFSAPMELGGLSSADPLDPAVIAWWKAKADEIYALIPDFGGWMVKANSEGQPGPGDYGRTQANGATLLADALAPYGGIVHWRAFIYNSQILDDRAKQAYAELTPLDGQFRENVLVQVKNGPIDFQPREPFHPLFGAMPKTNLSLEVQITQEYLGQGTHLCYLA
ncbi:MAG TPA: alpha-glucuronidase family glycosyl hydrolase, partial [Phototrophicaceae bacterium]|nr:alpha-glucuronidase family glycosyl hydrolase [Phototrophicaceae bacterium]